MNFMIAAATDVGIRKQTNQDSLMMKKYDTHIGEVVFVVLCDGMGGFEKGEVASATAVKAFENWASENLCLITDTEEYEHIIRSQWLSLVTELNEKIMKYGKSEGIKIGTTIVAMLITPNRYYLINVGDSRAYALKENSILQLTKDQTLVAREVELGHMTVEQAQSDPRRNVLLQCVGASERVFPDIFCGNTEENTVYMFCSDGFRHEITSEEMYKMLAPEVMNGEVVMEANIRYLVDLNIRRNETDNITAAAVRTY